MTTRLKGPKKIGWRGVTARQARRWIGKAISADLYRDDASRTYYPYDCLAVWGLVEDVRNVDGVMAIVFTGNDAVRLSSVAAIQELPIVWSRSPITGQQPYIRISSTDHAGIDKTDPARPVTFIE